MVVDAMTTYEGPLQKKISIHAPLLREPPLANFPVGVLISEDADLSAKADAEGADIHFTTVSGEPLNFEIESYASSTGALIAWVQVPMIFDDAPTTPTEIYMRYRDPTKLNLQNREAVWADAAGVWHFAEDPMGTAPQFLDSTPQRNFARVANGPTAAPLHIPGIAGDGLEFSGVGDSVVFDDASLLNFPDSFSFSLWVNVNEPLGSADTPFANGTSRGYRFVLTPDNWCALLSTGLSDYVACIGENTSTLQSGWVHLVGVADKSSSVLLIYSRGALNADMQSFSGASLDPTNGASLSPAGQPFKGQLDELRIYPRALSDDWIATENKNLSVPEEFLTIGPEEPIAN
jgi:hypothetical protein